MKVMKTSLMLLVNVRIHIAILQVFVRLMIKMNLKFFKEINTFKQIYD